MTKAEKAAAKLAAAELVAETLPTIAEAEALDAVINAAHEEAIPMHEAFLEALKKASVFSLSGKMDIICRGGAQIARSALRTLAKDAKSGLTYVGRNSAKEKCAHCSPLSASVNWERFSFQQDEVTHEMWICECGRAYPSGKGKKAFPSLRTATEAE